MSCDTEKYHGRTVPRRYWHKFMRKTVNLNGIFLVLTELLRVSLLTFDKILVGFATLNEITPLILLLLQNMQ